MIGDLRIVLKRFIKQHILCKHAYKGRLSKGHPAMTYEKCVKCGRVKW